MREHLIEMIDRIVILFPVVSNWERTYGAYSLELSGSLSVPLVIPLDVILNLQVAAPLAVLEWDYHRHMEDAIFPCALIEASVIMDTGFRGTVDQPAWLIKSPTLVTDHPCNGPLPN